MIQRVKSADGEAKSFDRMISDKRLFRTNHLNKKGKVFLRGE